MTESEADSGMAGVEAVGADAEGSSAGPNPIFQKLGVEIPAARRWQQLLSGAIVLLVAYAVFTQLFRDGGLAMPGQGAEASWPILGPAIAAAALAAVVDPRLALRALLAIPVLALIGLAILTFASGNWTMVLPVEATRIGLAILAYALVAIAAAVAATRLSVLPSTVLMVAVALVAGGMGLWGFANFVDPLAVMNQGELTPAGPFRYRNTLALLAVASLVPLMRWSVWSSFEKPEVLLSIVSGFGLGVSVIVVATSGSDFAWLITLALLALVVSFPARTLGQSRQSALGMSITVVAVALVAWFIFRRVLDQMPGSESDRTLIMVGLVVATPLVVWAASTGLARVPDRVALRLVQASAILAVVAGIVVLSGASGVYSGDLTQSRQAYYEVAIETAKEEPIKGFGAGSFAQASLTAQTKTLFTQTRFAHTIPGEMWVELGIGGLGLSLLLYGGSFLLSWRTRLLPGGFLLIPLVLGFLLSGLIDWSWHMTAMTALWASGLGGLIGIWLARRSDGTTDGGRPDGLSESSA